MSYIKREYFKSSGTTNETVVEFLNTIPNDNEDDNDNDNDNDSIVTTNRPRIANESLSKEQYDEILSLWNSIEGLPKCKSLTDQRKKNLNARVKEYSYEVVINALHMIAESDWLRGNNDRHWVPDFGWWIKPENFVKIIEGKYNNKDANSSTEKETQDEFER